jgi:hypothetical protein
MTLSERFVAVNERIARACERARRRRDEVRLVAVSKRHPPEQVAAVADCGQTLFGESRVQEAEAKIPMCPEGLDWHFIGHLQRNKVRRTVPLFSMIHSVDSLRLLEAVDGACAECGRVMPVCLEVNVSGEPSKFGIEPEVLRELLEEASGLHHVDVTGLMTMAPWSDDTEKARPHFRRLRQLKERSEAEWNFPLGELSMGMSNDFEVAIEEGATLIRVGTDLFGERE